ARDALASLGDFFAQFPSHERMDEAWFLRGQAYEINGAQRNVRLALEAYKTILERFPHSPYWKKADERARFIKNFFIKIS
ncbi:outer membrane protein assembly factor BamD, partial [Treponema pallidum]